MWDPWNGWGAAGGKFFPTSKGSHVCRAWRGGTHRDPPGGKNDSQVSKSPTMKGIKGKRRPREQTILLKMYTIRDWEAQWYWYLALQGNIVIEASSNQDRVYKSVIAAPSCKSGWGILWYRLLLTKMRYQGTVMAAPRFLDGIRRVVQCNLTL